MVYGFLNVNITQYVISNLIIGDTTCLSAKAPEWLFTLSFYT